MSICQEYNIYFSRTKRENGIKKFSRTEGKLLYTGTRIPDPPFSTFGPSRDYGMALCQNICFLNKTAAGPRNKS